MSKKQILLLIVVIIGISAGFIAYKIHRQNVIAHGEDLLQRGEFQQVIDLLNENVQGASGSSSERILVAQAYYYQGNFKQALEVLDPLLRYGAENPKAALVSGWIQIEQGNLLTAQERFSLAKQQGYEAQAEAGLGAIALKESEGYKKTELSEAEMYLSGALNKNSTLPHAHYYLAELHLIRHEYEAAIGAAETLIGLAPKWAQSHLILGRAHLLAGNYEKAEAAFEASLEYGASEGDTKFYLAQSLYLQGRLRESLEFMHQLADMESDRSREAKENAAKIHLILGEQIQAESLLREAWETQSSPQTGIQLYSVLTRLNKQKEAETLINEMVENRPFLSEAQLELGHTLFEQNLLKPAYFAYQQVLDNDPQNFWAEYNLGCLALARQEPMQAPDYFQTAIQSAPDFYPAQINLAFSQFTQQQSEQTDLFLNELAEKFPKAPHIRLAQALKTFYSGQVEEAVRIIEQSLEDRQNTVRGNLLLGAMHMRLFQYEKALDCYENALQAQPDNHRAKLGKAHALYRLGDSKSAGDIYRELQSLNLPSSSTILAEIKNGNALVALQNNNVSDSLNDWDMMKKLSPFARKLATVNATLIDPANPTEMQTMDLEKAANEKNPLPESLYNLALFYEMMGDQTQAIDQYEQLVSQYPSFLPGLFNLSDLYRKRGFYQQAITFFEKTREAAPRRADVFTNEAATQIKYGQPEKAEALLEQAVGINPNSSAIRLNQALTALHQNDLEKTQEYLTNLQSLGGAKGATEMIQGLMEAQKENWPQAKEAFAAAQTRDDQNPYNALNLGIALAKMEQYQKAEDVLRQAINLDPSLAASHRALGLLYCKLGLFEEALKILQVSLRLDPSQEDLNDITKQIQGWINKI